MWAKTVPKPSAASEFPGIPARRLLLCQRMAKRNQPHICLVCWDKDAAAYRTRSLTAGGFRVTLVDRPIPGWISWFRDLALDAVVLDLNRLPSHGREVGTLLRGSKSTRHLPLVFLGGPPEKVARIRGELPDASYADWPLAPETIRAAISTHVDKPVRPAQMMERNASADLGRKLGVKPQVPVVLWGDADFLLELMGDAPNITRRPQPGNDTAHLCLCVTRSAAEVEAAFDALASYPAGTTLWIIHPKQTGRQRTDFNQNDVRDIGLASGWVDFKVCSVDADWSGLQFARRKPGQKTHVRMKAAKKGGKKIPATWR